MKLKAMAELLLQAKHGVKLSLNNVENGPKLSPPESLIEFSQPCGTPYLDRQGRFCVRGGLLAEPLLDALLQVGAGDHEIEKHVHPIGTPGQWARWTEIKRARAK